MAKITIIMHDLRGGGAEQMMVRLANELIEQAYTVDIILVGAGGINKPLLDSKVGLYELGCKRTLTSLIPLRKALKCSAPDAVLSVLTHINVISFFACLSLNWLTKLSVSERNAYSLDKLVNQSKLMRLVYALAPLTYRLLPKPVIAVSQGVADDLIEHSMVRKVDTVVAPNPVITLQSKAQALQPAQHPWLADKSVPTLIAVGRLSQQKGFDYLISAFAEVRSALNCRLVIFGEGELKSELQQQVAALGLDQAVDFAGYSNNILAEMKAADLYVLSSRFEGSPNTLVEAMSVGTKVVAFDCPHGPKEILQDGKVAPLVPMGNVDALSQAILDGIDKPSNYDAACAPYHARASANCYAKLLLSDDLLIQAVGE